MCHLILALPIVGLPLLWLLPAPAGLAAYAVLVLVSVAVYAVATKAMRMPVVVGGEALNHAVGSVRSVDDWRVSVFVRGELWFAESVGGALAPGDRVEVVGRDGFQLRVRRLRDVGGAESKLAKAPSGDIG